MSYTVLARKYRPQTFADLVGQEHVSRTLGNAIGSGRVAHAFLFTGARGVGKTTTARLLAKALNCEKGPAAEPCNACDACREITAGTDLDVLEIDGASNNSVDDVRRLQESLPFRPARDRFKIVIVDEVHMLSTGAFNAFLKTLEEPPSHVKFIFATTEVHKVPVTIRSRCQRYDFRLIPHAVVSARVRALLAREQISADDDAIAIVAREAAGSMRDALTVLDQLLALGGDGLRGDEVARGLGIASRAHVLQVVEAMLTGDAAGCLRIVKDVAEQGLDLLHFARQLVACARDLVVLRVVGDDHELVDLVLGEREHALRVATSQSAEELERAFSGLGTLVEEVGRSSAPQLVLEMGLLRLSHRPPLVALQELLARLRAMESRLGPGGTGAAPQRPFTPPAQRGPAGNAPPKPAAQGAAPAKVSPAPAPPEAHDGPLPEAWVRIVAQLKSTQPALGAVLDHGVPLEVSARTLRIGFPEGSFFGRQAAASAAREAIARVAEQLLGARPEIVVAAAADTKAATVAAVESSARQERDAQRKQAALGHPRVREALEVFDETAASVDVQLDVE